MNKFYEFERPFSRLAIFFNQINKNFSLTISFNIYLMNLKKNHFFIKFKAY